MGQEGLRRAGLPVGLLFELQKAGAIGDIDPIGTPQNPSIYPPWN